MSGRIAVVDSADRFVRWEERRVIHERRLWHRSVHVMLFDSAGRLVVQRRHPNKDTHPSHWDISASGHVEESDYTGGPDDDLHAVYMTVACRELQEELGVTPQLDFLAHLEPVEGLHYEQIHLIRAFSDGPYRPQAEEVEEIRVLDAPALEALFASGEPVTPMLRFLAAWPRTPARAERG